MELQVSLRADSYPIVIEPGCSARLQEYIDLDIRTMLVYDDGIPVEWVDRIRRQLSDVHSFKFKQGEQNKNFSTLEALLASMSEAGLNRKSRVIALGGGVTGDMAGLAAALFMRGIPYINIPTTVLSQVDSSVGGKTAVDLGSVKNIVGAFKQPQRVFIDPDLLSTLDPRQVRNGLSEALKMTLLFEPALLEEFEKDQPDLLKLIAASIDWKRKVVEEDEKETGLRKSLNFGHTIGHAIEGSFENFDYLHGECVAAGMLYFIEDENLARRVLSIEKKLGLPEIETFDLEKASALLHHDKKSAGEGVACVVLKAPGEFTFETLDWQTLNEKLKENPYEKYNRTSA